MMAGGIYTELGWPDDLPDERWDCVEVCDHCHAVVWSTRWDERVTDGFRAYLARLGWRNYCVKGDPEILELCPDCAVRALLLGETGGLADTWLRPVRAYTYAVAQVNEQLDARQRVVANLLLTDGRAS